MPPIVAAGPLVIITMRSESSTASSTSCVTMTTVELVRATMPMSSSCRCARVSASSAPKGSSISSTLGSIASARAMPTRCFMPPEISSGYLVAAGSSPTSASAAAVRAFSCALLSVSPNTRSTASITFPAQVSQGSSEWFWNTTPRSGPGPAISLLASSRCPAVGRSSPARRFSSVDLPQPEWPISVTNSPLATVRLMSRRASKRIPRRSKTMPTVSTSMYLSMRPLARDAVADTLRHEDQRLLEHESHHADHEDGDQDVVDLEVVPLVPDPEADADAAGEHLGRDDHQPRHADRQAHAGEHVRQHRGKEDAGEDLPFREVQHARHVEVVLGHLAHARGGVHDQRPDRADEDAEDRRRIGGLEKQQADRQPGERAHGLEQRDDRRRHVGEEAEAPDEEARRDAHQRREPEAHADPPKRREHVPADALIVRPLAVEGIGEDHQRFPEDRGGIGNAAELRDEGPG